jgi:hypothetical protein
MMRLSIKTFRCGGNPVKTHLWLLNLPSDFLARGKWLARWLGEFSPRVW